MLLVRVARCWASAVPGKGEGEGQTHDKRYESEV